MQLLANFVPGTAAPRLDRPPFQRPATRLASPALRAPQRFPAAMQIIPAIDIKDGHCVRLKQGEMHSATVFSEDPAAMAQHWLEQGAKRLHIVDLNGAVAGKPKNELAIREIVSVVGEEIPVQLGGGIRDLDTIERYLDDGITYVIIGTAAVKNPGFLHDACYAFPGHIIVGLDARDGKVATDGWSKMTGHDVIDLAKKFEDYGVEAIIYTDIGRDGMLTGVNIEATVRARARDQGAGDRLRRPRVDRRHRGAREARERRHHRRDRRPRALRGHAGLQAAQKAAERRNGTAIGDRRAAIGRDAPRRSYRHRRPWASPSASSPASTSPTGASSRA